MDGHEKTGGFFGNSEPRLAGFVKHAGQGCGGQRKEKHGTQDAVPRPRHSAPRPLPEHDGAGNNEKQKRRAGQQNVKGRQRGTQPRAGVPFHHGLPRLAVHTEPLLSRAVSHTGDSAYRDQNEKVGRQLPVKFPKRRTHQFRVQQAIREWQRKEA